MKPKISIVTLGVSDFQKSYTFYKEGLGFPTHKYKDGDDIVFFELQGSWLGLYLVDKLAEDATVASSEGSGFRGVTLAHNESSKEDVDTVFETAIKAGATKIKKPQDVFWGGYSGYFADPDGHLWEVAYNPFMDLT